MWSGGNALADLGDEAEREDRDFFWERVRGWKIRLEGIEQYGDSCIKW